MAHADPVIGAGEEAGAARVVLGEEPEVLRRMRQFELLDGIRTMAQRKRRALFTGQTAMVVNAVCIRVCDCFGAYLQGMGEEQVIARHGDTVRIMDVLLDLFADPSVLARWKYSPEQIMWFVDRLGPTVGAGRDPETEACGEVDSVGCDRDESGSGERALGAGAVPRAAVMRAAVANLQAPAAGADVVAGGTGDLV